MPSKKLLHPFPNPPKVTIKRKKLSQKEKPPKKTNLEEEKQTNPSESDIFKIQNTVFGVNRAWERKKLEDIEMAHEKTFQNYHFNSALPLSLIPRVLALMPKEPSIRLEIIKSPIAFNLIPTNYIITCRGVVGSLRVPKDEKIKEAIIGRKGLDELGGISTDIILNQKDLSLSRTHCKIVYGNWFKQKEISLDLLEFLMANQRKKNPLPKHILSNIKSYMQERKRLMLSDLGSVYGTFRRVKEGEKIEMKKKMSFMIAPKLGFDVVEIYGSLSDFIQNNENLGILKQRFVGNSERNTQVYEGFIEEVFQDLICNVDVKNTGALFASSNMPCLRLKFMKPHQTGILISECEYLIVKKIDQQKFSITFGPTNKSYYKVDSNISFKISYQETNNKWILNDVSSYFQNDQSEILLEKKGDFGLWSSFSEGKGGNLRYKPIEKEVRNDDEIKVGETVFKLIF